MVLDIVILAKTSFFGPEKAAAKAAADSLLKTRVGCAGKARKFVFSQESIFDKLVELDI
jgi:hypothetical protein